jgi:hypothetical protein
MDKCGKIKNKHGNFGGQYEICKMILFMIILFFSLAENRQFYFTLIHILSTIKLKKELPSPKQIIQHPTLPKLPTKLYTILP